MVNDNPKAYFRWGQALVGMGEYDDAVVQYNKAKDLAPNGKDYIYIYDYLLSSYYLA